MAMIAFGGSYQIHVHQTAEEIDALIAEAAIMETKWIRVRRNNFTQDHPNKDTRVYISRIAFYEEAS